MSLVKGKFDLKWGDNTLSGIESIDISYDQASDDLETLQGQTLEVDGPAKVTAVITLLETDIPAIAALLPQYYIANGEDLSTGETVDYADGAIEINAATCNDSIVYNHFDIISCANPSDVLRIVHARTKFDGVSVDNKIRKVMIKIVGEPAIGDGFIQLFKQGTVATVS